MKNFTRQTFSASFSLLCLLVAAPCFPQPLKADQPLPPTTFGSFSHDPAFAQIYLSHLQPLKMPNNELFHGTWFLGDDAGVAMVCRVDVSGKGFSGRSVYHRGFQSDGSIRSNGGIKLNPDRVAALRSALHSLPPSSVRVPLARLLLLSYRDNNVWVVRQYDRQHLPEQVRQVYSLVRAMI